jgi:phospholipid-translocating ATPase
MVGTIMFFNESFTNIVTITFSALIITELLNVYSSVSSKNPNQIQVHRIQWVMIVTSMMTLFIYITSIALLPNYFQTSYITWNFVLKVGMLTIVSWLPLQIV